MRTDKKPLTAIVTGASTGIGYAIAKRFVNDGFNVVMNARTLQDLNAAHAALAAPGQTRIFAGDIADRTVGQKLANLAQKEFGGVDVLINNAGVFAAKPFLETDEPDLDHFYGINFKGAYFVSQAVIPMMIKQGGGSIVNISTTLLEHAITGFPASAALASKAALSSLTEQLSAEFGANNIRVSTINTGIIETPLHAKHGIDDTSGLRPLHLLNRNGAPEDVAEAAMMLATNDFISGTTLRVDGGHSAGHIFG